MKRIIVILLIIVFAFMATSCGTDNKATESSNEFAFFVKIAHYYNTQFGDTEFFYDPFTKIVYVYIVGYHRAGLSPYYIIENGEPVIAQYGINWTEADLKK